MHQRRPRSLLFCALMLLIACGDDDDKPSKPGPDVAGSSDSDMHPQSDAATPNDAAQPSEQAGHAAMAAEDAGTQNNHEQVGDDGGVGAGVPPKLAAGGPQLLAAGDRLGLQLTAANLADDAPVIAVHQEFYGIPWAEFEANTAPPSEWSALVGELATFAGDQRKPVFLSLSVLNGARERLAATTRIEAGRVRVDDTSSDTCYDFATASDHALKQTAYLRYVDYMIDRFHPSYLDIAIEVNLFFESCPAATAGLVTMLNAVYDHVKQAHQDMVVFPSFQIDHLYGYADKSCPDQSKRDSCFDTAYAQLAGLKRDRFAMSSYPFLSQVAAVKDLPADWFERGAKRGGEKGLIAETGWPSTALIARNGKTCVPVFTYTEADTVAYLQRVLSDSARLGIALVTWWSDRDLVPAKLMTDCPCTFDATWCSVLDAFRGPEQPLQPDLPFYGEMALKAFGSMGLRSYDGTAKTAALKLWNSAKRP